MGTEIDETVYARIGVREPYFALRGVRFPSPGEAVCAVPVEQQPGEQAPLTISEAARHSAILGLCAAASGTRDGRRRYYLARRGSLDRLATRSRPTGPLSGQATGELRSERAATTTSTILTASEEPLFRLELEFAVFSAEAFERVFAHTRRGDEPPSPPSSPYTSPPEPEGVRLGTRSASATITPGLDACPGHFPGFPTLPIAMLGSSLERLGLLLLERFAPGPRRIPWHLELIHASRLIPAERDVKLRAEVDSHDERGPTLLLKALLEDEEIFSMRVGFAPAS
ncbi:hypothetical protein [Actinopolyspora mortivallis]|uniref:A-factor biosynthesis hotdog domain-containing protein n=1 Tax=Actinopolyspora mortivallis TaxID=33906 RepID=A0A2T0GWV1_ACTMO|nr:hypothetical protein [Actinopolyspora mortivallis]PRW63590.1 hypothetical protein CEP50_09735 [Actinopolyspora mortivallis]